MKFNSNIINCAIMNNFKLSYDALVGHEINTANGVSLNDKIKPLKELMEKTDKVRIVGPNTDITFSIKGLPAIPCCGTCNIPDGELNEFIMIIENYINEFKIKDKDYKGYSEAIDAIIQASGSKISRNGFDHLVWYYFK